MPGSGGRLPTPEPAPAPAGEGLPVLCGARAPGIAIDPAARPRPFPPALPLPLPLSASPRLMGGTAAAALPLAPPPPRTSGPGEMLGPERGERATDVLGRRMGKEPVGAAPAFAGRPPPGVPFELEKGLPIVPWPWLAPFAEGVGDPRGKPLAEEELGRPPGAFRGERGGEMPQPALPLPEPAPEKERPAHGPGLP